MCGDFCAFLTFVDRAFCFALFIVFRWCSCGDSLCGSQHGFIVDFDLFLRSLLKFKHSAPTNKPIIAIL